MSDVSVVEKKDFHALVVHKVVGTFSLKKVMGPAYEGIMNVMREAGISCPEGQAPFTRYNRIDWCEMEKRGFCAMLRMMFVKKWDMDIGIPVPDQAAGKGEIVRIVCQPGKCLESIHTGPYAKVATAYTRILEKARAEGLELADHSYEFYLNDPRTVSPEALQTKVLVPLKD